MPQGRAALSPAAAVRGPASRRPSPFLLASPHGRRRPALLILLLALLLLLLLLLLPARRKWWRPRSARWCAMLPSAACR
jgi:hypothetical protein